MHRVQGLVLRSERKQGGGLVELMPRIRVTENDRRVPRAGGGGGGVLHPSGSLTSKYSAKRIAPEGVLVHSHSSGKCP